jgi:hypothetical protein
MTSLSLTSFVGFFFATASGFLALIFFFSAAAASA